jgi:hypothetical protein
MKITKAAIIRREIASKLKRLLKSRFKKINIVRNMIKKGIYIITTIIHYNMEKTMLILNLIFSSFFKHIDLKYNIRNNIKF